MNYLDSKAPNNTVTRNLDDLDKDTGSIYESIQIIAKRAEQIAVEMKIELDKKLAEFASYSDNLEEIFENREQIEISKFYEKLPKPTLIAIEEFLNNEIYFRLPSEDELLENDIVQ
ncbi:MAG TPA: RNA polymerase Rpb6 [Bacteroidales bacterium]|nr:RNA polymerase Rpb6 [Bacteroidales bacterium]